eukprot:TRINITY_DN57442_c0_g1_i1.p1 TRINITY_DN57442_c0_g1~~TRINITY_DN57442_c0_g1_i1.p1  ORF type:complete len:175 (-),score=15.72 TRINITY_DN57442_c0_g1_i1:137-661(-)
MEEAVAAVFHASTSLPSVEHIAQFRQQLEDAKAQPPRQKYNTWITSLEDNKGWVQGLDPEICRKLTQEATITFSCESLQPTAAHIAGFHAQTQMDARIWFATTDRNLASCTRQQLHAMRPAGKPPEYQSDDTYAINGKQCYIVVGHTNNPGKPRVTGNVVALCWLNSEVGSSIW